MLDLSEETKEENIADCVKYFKRMAKMERKCPSRLPVPQKANIQNG
jgi:hypothetical protein